MYLQVVEVSARYDDICMRGTGTNAEREARLMKVNGLFDTLVLTHSSEVREHNLKLISENVRHCTHTVTYR